MLIVMVCCVFGIVVVSSVSDSGMIVVFLMFCIAWVMMSIVGVVVRVDLMDVSVNSEMLLMNRCCWSKWLFSVEVLSISVVKVSV